MLFLIEILLGKFYSNSLISSLPPPKEKWLLCLCAEEPSLAVCFLYDWEGQLVTNDKFPEQLMGIEITALTLLERV